jgi:MATE family multidrug resistance protein
VTQAQAATNRPAWKLDSELTGRLMSMAYPVVFAMLTQTAINLLDTIMVGRLPVQYSIAGQSAIGYTLILLWGIGGFLSSFQVGTQAITARRFGGGDLAGAGRTLSNSLVLTITTSVIAAVGAFYVIESAFPFFNSDPDVLRLGTPYAKWRMLGIFPMVTVVSFKAFFDGIGFTKAHMMAAIVMNICNVILNYIFIFGWGPIEPMYVEGAGLASAISSGVGTLMMMGISLRPKYLKTYEYFSLKRLNPKIMWEITRLSIPSGFATMFVMTGFALFLKIVGMLDEEAVQESITALAAWTPSEARALAALEGQPLIGDLHLNAAMSRPSIYAAATKVIMDAMSIAFMTCIAFGTATATLVSQSLGGGRDDLAERFGWESVRIGFYIMAAFGLFTVLFPETVMGVFSKDQAVILAGRNALRLMAVSTVFISTSLILAQALYGAGDTKFVMKVEFILHVTCLVPLAYVLGLTWDFGLVGIWAAALIYLALMAGIMAWKFSTGDWKSIDI